MFLGSLLDSGSLETGEYTPLTGKRGGMTFSVSHQSLSDVGAVDEVKLSAVREELKRITSAQDIGASTAQISFEVNSVRSREHVRVVLGAAGGGASVVAGGLFSSGFRRDRNQYLIKFVQTYYSADADLFPEPADAWAPKEGWEQVSRDITNETSPVYVSSVKVGRLVLFAMET